MSDVKDPLGDVFKVPAPAPAPKKKWTPLDVKETPGQTRSGLKFKVRGAGDCADHKRKVQK